ncbi:MAG: hypothetical protein RIS90_1353 [Pseudomonadota bacterium]|jgi:hypothetical protein
MLQAALRTQGAAADAMAVVEAHVAAVRCGDADLMSADYTEAARITRGMHQVVPRDYFPLALQRLGCSQLVVHSLTRIDADASASGTRIAMQWALCGGRADGTRGTDTFTVVGDRITHQQVDLHTADY